MQFQFLMSVFGCHFSMHRFIYLAFAATSILKCITRWRTRRRRTKTTKKQQLAFIRNEESDSSPPSCGLYVEISRASLAPKMNALFPNIQSLFCMEQTNKMQCAPSYVLLTVFETTTCALLYCLLYKGECYFGICEATFYLVASFHRLSKFSESQFI